VNAAPHFDSAEVGHARIDADFFRLHGSDALAPYLITLCVRTHHAVKPGLGYPQARAVIDDFGTLQVVREWL
jgi:hypothetical protein